MRRLLVLYFLVSSGSSLCGQKIPLTLFKDSLLPRSGAGDLYDVTQSPNRFEVSMSHDSLVVVLDNDSSAPRATFTTKNGTLTGNYFGENGGHLIHTSNNGDADTIFTGPVQHIFSCYNRIFFTSGLWHMSTHYGQLFQLDTGNGQFKAKIFSSFDYPIRHCHVTRDTMYLVTYGKLYRMQYGKAVVIAELPFIATSMVTHGRFMFFGMRGGYARLDMKTLRFRYFVYTGQ